MSIPEYISSENNLEKLCAAAPDLVDAMRGGENPLIRHQDPCTLFHVLRSENFLCARHLRNYAFSFKGTV
jgi:hypothetical protein